MARQDSSNVLAKLGACLEGCSVLDLGAQPDGQSSTAGTARTCSVNDDRAHARSRQRNRRFGQINRNPAVP
jgi:hypothetical protein